ncbi:hypothetical protein TrVE_jg8165 [Triparma verrucosa]|uniref:Uncharacterized protein n=1 Tax=Triparma verrucosa TaxID=1606542 RepID=A0A9W7CHY1_9STRA|nr:hypothetical protein TrVE_jg8165 [Triparma verrucosa]
MAEISLSISEENLPTNPDGEDPTPELLNQKTTTVQLSSINSHLSNLPDLPKSHPDLYADLLLDGEITDSPLLPRTFLITPSALSPSSRLTYFEYLSLQILHHHTSSLPPSTPLSAEYWFQIRPSSPSTSRQPQTPTKLSKNGITFHYDKDESLHNSTGVHIFPHISTVTYLTGQGGPTMVVGNVLKGLGGLGGEGGGGGGKDLEVIFPETFKHMSFDGRKLHGGDPRLGTWNVSDDEIERGYGLRGKERFKDWFKNNVRVTFLVNVWVYHRPNEVERMDEFYRGKMTPVEKVLGGELGDFRWEDHFPSFFGKERKEEKEEGIENGVIAETVVKKDEADLITFEYELGKTGGMDERYEGAFPIGRIRENAKEGKDSKVVWEDGDMSKIVVEKSAKRRKTEEEK